MDRVAQQVLEGFGHVDTLVTCVGDSIRKPVVQLPGTSTPGMTEDEWHDRHQPTEAPGCRALGPAGARGRGVNISGWAFSEAGPGRRRTTRPKPGSCASPNPWPRRPLRRPGQRRGPGLLPRPRADVAGGLPATGCRRCQDCPPGRVGRLKEVGYLAVFLASPAAAYVTGRPGPWTAG